MCNRPKPSQSDEVKELSGNLKKDRPTPKPSGEELKNDKT